MSFSCFQFHLLGTTVKDVWFVVYIDYKSILIVLGKFLLYLGREGTASHHVSTAHKDFTLHFPFLPPGQRWSGEFSIAWWNANILHFENYLTGQP